MSTGWSETAAVVGKRLLQIIAVIIVEEVVRQSFESAFEDEHIKYEKPRKLTTRRKKKKNAVKA